MKIVQQLDEHLWREFVDNHPQGQIFHTPEMFQVFARAEGHRATLWAAVGDDGQVLALLLPIQITLLNGPLRYLTTRAIVYGSALCAPGSQGQMALATLLDAYKRQVKEAPLFTELRNLSDLSDIQPVLKDSGFAYDEHLNFLIDLDQPEETILKKISKSGRQSVRTSRNKGTVIEEVTEQQKVRIAYRLLEQIYKKVQVPLADRTLFEAAFDIMAPRGMFKIFLARVDERYIGACLVLAYKGRIIDWYAASDRDFSSYCPGEFLIWHTLQWGRQNHFHLFDFGGGGRPNESYGPREFKSKFGGTLVNYGRNICVHAPLKLKLSQVGYQLLRRFL
jgi:CelD/BcsL family acetyltransferase involved in cellulose biosynthesis